LTALQRTVRGTISLNRMNINTKATNIEITPAIADYIQKKFSAFDKFVNNNSGSARCDVEVGKTTHHHRSGDVFRAEVNLHIEGKSFYAVSELDDLYAAIDVVKDEVIRQVTSDKDKSNTLYRRGALHVKNILKGIDFRGRFKKK
jgi:putative sigma-54 modulation protein